MTEDPTEEKPHLFKTTFLKHYLSLTPGKYTSHQGPRLSPFLQHDTDLCMYGVCACVLGACVCVYVCECACV